MAKKSENRELKRQLTVAGHATCSAESYYR